MGEATLIWLIILGFAFMLALICDDGPIDYYLIKRLNKVEPKQLYQYQLFARKGGRTLHVWVTESTYSSLAVLMTGLKVMYDVNEACYLTRRPC